MGSGKYLLKAISKEGIEKFVKTILFDFDNFEEMNEKEKELVPFSACYPNDPMSYNLVEGGHSPILVGKRNPMYGEHIKDHMTPEAYESWKKKVGDAVRRSS